MAQTSNNSELLYQQAKTLFDQAKAKFDDGTIQTEPQLVQEVFQSFQKFFTSIGKPSFVPRYATENGPLWSEDFNSMMDEIRIDLEILYREADLLGDALYTDFNHHSVQYTAVKQQFSEVNDKLKDLEIYSKYTTDGMLQFGRDDFFNSDRIDYDKISGKPLEIHNGILTLPTKEGASNAAADAQISIVTGNKSFGDYILGSESNGFPGNNAEVSVVADPYLTNGDSYFFVSRDNNHGNYGAVLDGDANTWFEYERVNVRDQEKIRVAKNLGWEYQVYENKTIPFAKDPENGRLKLHLQIMLKKETIINQINVNMYTPPNYGARTANIKDITVAAENGIPESILSSVTKDGYSFHFEPRKVKVVHILFEQSQKYMTDIGHLYFKKKITTKKNGDYVFDTLNQNYQDDQATRLDGPKISLTDLGVKVDVKNTDVSAYYPVKGENSDAISLQEIVNRITGDIDLDTVDMGIERFEGWRYCIGVQDIEILSAEYETEGELVTKPIYFEKPLDKISLSTESVLPDFIKENPDIKYDWLKFFISIDDGSTWNPITPLEYETMSMDDPPKIYTIHQVQDSDAKLSDKGYLESVTPVYSIRLRIVLSRPEDAEISSMGASTVTPYHSYSTPKLNNYLIQASTREIDLNTEALDQIKNLNVEPTYPTHEYTPPTVIPNPIPEDPTPPPPPAPPDDHVDPNPETPPPTSNLKVIMDNKVAEWCSNKDLTVVGSITSNLNLKNAILLINGQEIKNESLNNIKEYAFNWTITSKQLQDLGFDIDDQVFIQVGGTDELKTGSDNETVTLIDCSTPPPPNDCWEFDKLFVHYYNPTSQKMEQIELSATVLPYTASLSDGTQAIIGWNQANSSASITLRSGKFIVDGVGVHYIDFNNNEKTVWSSTASGNIPPDTPLS